MAVPRCPPTTRYARCIAVRLRLWSTLLILLVGWGLAGCDSGDETDLPVAPQMSGQAVEAVPLVSGAIDPGSVIGQRLLGDGWCRPETYPGGTYAWTRQTRAVLYLPLIKAGTGDLVLTGNGPAAAGSPRNLEIRVNGHSLGERELPAQSGQIRFGVEPYYLRAGLNEVELVVDRTVRPCDIGPSRDSRTLGVRVDRLQLVPSDAPVPGDPYDTGLGAQSSPDTTWWCFLLHHGAGAEFSATWSGDARPAVRYLVARQPGGAPELTGDLTIAHGRATLDLPDTLQGSRWLLLEGGDRPQETTLRRSLRPLEVVLIIIDTLRPDYLGCYGGRRAATLAIDGLAADGILFETALCHSPITGPSHGSLFTSHLPSETRLVNNGQSLPQDMPLLAEILSEAGYSCQAAVGIGPIMSAHGFNRGFEQYDDRMRDLWILPARTVFHRAEPMLAAPVRPAFTWVHFADPHEPYDAHGLVERTATVTLQGDTVATIPTSTYTPARLAIDLPAGRSELVLSSADPFNVRNIAVRLDRNVLAPLKPKEPPVRAVTKKRFWIGPTPGGEAELVLDLSDLIETQEELCERYAREVEYTDRFVGAVLDSLKAARRYRDVLIIFTADHGEALGAHGHRGHVETLYDAMVRVPLIIKPPRGYSFRPGSRRRDQAALTDILPTVLAQLSITPLPGARGRDLLAPRAERQEMTVFLETHRPEAERDLYGLRTITHKVVYEPATGIWELYDLRRDPDELRDLAPRHPELLDRYRTLLLSKMASLNVATSGGPAGQEIDARSEEMLRSLGY
jgi:hypothetical protein